MMKETANLMPVVLVIFLHAHRPVPRSRDSTFTVPTDSHGTFVLLCNRGVFESGGWGLSYLRRCFPAQTKRKLEHLLFSCNIHRSLIILCLFLNLFNQKVGGIFLTITLFIMSFYIKNVF